MFLNVKCKCWCLSIIELKNARWNIEIWVLFLSSVHCGTKDSRLQKVDTCCGTHPTPCSTSTEFFNRVREFGHRPAPSDKVKNVWSHISTLHRPLCRGAYLNTRKIYLFTYLLAICLRLGYWLYLPLIGD